MKFKIVSYDRLFKSKAILFKILDHLEKSGIIVICPSMSVVGFQFKRLICVKCFVLIIIQIEY